MKRTISIASLLATVAAGSAVAQGWAGTSGATGCGQLRRPATSAMAFTSTGAIPAELDGALVLVDPDGTAKVASAEPGVVRHVASSPGFGVAFVRDLEGNDVVEALRPQGPLRLPRPSEASNPSWSPVGDLVWAEGSDLGIWSQETGEVSTVAFSDDVSLLFSPVFADAARIVTVVSEPAPIGTQEGEYLSNLWSYDLRTATWDRVTNFSASRGRWSVVRTPILAPSGAIEFVRVVGTAWSTTQPTFQLWSLKGESSSPLRSLAGERFLAGYQGDARLWNVRDEESAAWRIFKEAPSGSLVPAGCGAVLVDPMDVADPDRAAVARAPRRSDTEPAGSGVATPPAREVAILVGDFASRVEAEAAAQQIRDVYGSGAAVKVLDSTLAPTAVRPGVWATILWIAPGADEQTELEVFRSRLPRFANSSWVVAP